MSDAAALILIAIRAGGREIASAAIGGWNADLRRLRESTVRARRTSAARWWLGFNGPALRLLDATRAYTRRSIDIDLEAVEMDDRALAAMQAILGGSETSLATLDALVRDTERHRAGVGTSLQAGVEDALPRLVGGFARGRGRRRRALDAAFGRRAHDRLPHPVPAVRRGARPRAAVASDLSRELHDRVAAAGRRRPAARRPACGNRCRRFRGSRIAAARAGTLRVVPFNGRLFAPSAAPLADTCALDDRRRARRAARRHDAARRRIGRERITYADLGVEQLGAVYERVLDYAPARERRGGHAPPLRRGARRPAPSIRRGR